MLIYTDIRAAFDKMTEGFEPELTGVSQFLFSCAVELYLCLYCEPFGRFYYELTSEPAFREKVEMIIITSLMKYTQRTVSQEQALLSCLSIMAIKPALVNYARQNPGQIEPDVMLRYYVEQQISVLGPAAAVWQQHDRHAQKILSEPGGLLHPRDDAAAAVLKPVCPRPQKGAGFFLPGRAGGGPLTARPARGILLSLRPRRASTFFRKESRQRFAKGLRPFEPPSLRPAVNLPLFRAAGRLNGPSGRNRRLTGETLEKPRSKAQLFKRFCA